MGCSTSEDWYDIIAIPRKLGNLRRRRLEIAIVKNCLMYTTIHAHMTIHSSPDSNN